MSDVEDTTQPNSLTNPSAESLGAEVLAGVVDSPEPSGPNTEYLSPTRVSPLRRSPRLSQAVKVVALDDDAELLVDEAANIAEEDATFGSSRPLTPENEGLIQDEPSSVLASRIMLAHDNPSPPPQSPEISQHLNLPTLSLPFPLLPSSENSSHTNTPSISTPTAELAQDAYIPSVSTSSFFNNLQTPTKSRHIHNISDQHEDLDHPVVLPATDIQPCAQSTISTDVVSEDSVDEQVVADTLVLSADETEVADAKSITQLLPQVDESPRPPLRRSTRPRRSTARYLPQFEESETDDRGPCDTTNSDDADAKLTSPRRKTITLAPNNVQGVLPSLAIDQPRSRSPTRESTLRTRTRRELGSLSPGSSTILKSLLPAAATSPLKEEIEQDRILDGGDSGSTLTLTQPASDLLSTPVRSTPARFTSPTRNPLPSKFQLQTADSDNKNRTPARRIPIQDAVANGQMSAQQAARLLSKPSTTLSSRPVFNIPATDSPVRRVLLPNSNIHSSPTKRLPLPGSPVRSLSVEPNPVEPVRLKKRAESAEPTLSKIQGKVAGTASPFSRSTSTERLPVTLKANSSLYATIPEEGSSSGGSAQKSVNRTGPYSEKSHLKHTTSRIPRIGLKPYARPVVSTNPKGQEKPITMRMLDSSKLQVASSKPQTSNSIHTGRTQIPSINRTPSPTKQRAPVPSTPTSLKRKRSSPEGLSPMKRTPVVLLSKKHPGPSSSPVKKHTVTQLRMVSDSDGVSSTRTNTGDSSSSVTEGLNRIVKPSSTEAEAVGHPVTTLRMVTKDDGILPNRSTTSTVPPKEATENTIDSGSSEGSNDVLVKPPSFEAEIEARPVTTLRMVTKDDGILPDRSTISSSPPPVTVNEEKTASTPPLLPPSSLSTAPRPVNAPLFSVPDAAESSSNPPPDTSDHAEPQPIPAGTTELISRRTTRSSRNGTVAAKPTSSSRPPSIRRKNVPTFTETGPFSGMTALALRTLTESNTSKNKDYVTVLLQTEVVRREGARPESPGMIVKSISQKEKEAKTRDRNARAERRAKRDNVESNREVDENGISEDEDLGRGWESSPLGKGKHAWGAGDEEDFETPVRPVKRVRADGEGFDDEDEKKRVKWDRGLYQEIYLDEIQPRTTHTRITQESIKKGCLAPTAKALPLDNLGNLPSIESPMKDITPENIVVKKFVYDSDVVEPVAPTSVPTNVKTRSKSKKSK